jgi:hypothetical protein
MKASKTSHMMAFIVMDFVGEYQKAVVKFVKNHVITEFRRGHDKGGNAAAYLRMAERKSTITSWSNTKHPLSYREGFTALSLALGESQVEVAKGLKWTEPEHISVHEFGQLLFNMGRPHNPAPLSPPLLHQSNLLDSLRITVQMFICFIGKQLPQNCTLADIFAGYIRFACNKLQINFGPWSAGGFPGSGYVRGKKHDRVVVPTTWCGFGKAPDPGSQVPFEMLNHEQALGYQLRMEEHRVVTRDTRAVWVTGEVMMDDLPTYFKRTINPSDLTLAEAGINKTTSDVVRNIYEWALQTFNINNPVHHLVLITAILYAKARPYLAWPEDAKARVPNVEHENAAKQKLIASRYICQLDWCDGRTEKNPLKEGGPFIPIFVTYFMAYAGGGGDSKSPLQTRGKIPPAWSSKHSMCFSKHRIGQ